MCSWPCRASGNRMRILLLFVLAELSVSLTAQSQDILARPLKAVKTYRTNETAPVITGFFRCDSSSNIYVQPYSKDRSAAILKISADGSRTQRIQLSSVPELAQAQFIDFAVTPRSEVFILAREPKTDVAYVAHFDGDGKHTGTIPINYSINHFFQPSSLAAFDAGELLISGNEYIVISGKPLARNNKGYSVPFLGIFNQNGDLVRRLNTLRGDLPVSKEGPRSKAKLAYDDAIMSSMMEMGTNGRVYLMRKTRSGPVLALDAAGSVVQVIQLVPPPKGDLTEVKVDDGQLLAVYIQQPEDRRKESSFELILKLVDLSTGTTIATYSTSEPDLGMGVACFHQGPSFTFVGADGRTGFLTRVDVEPTE